MNKFKRQLDLWCTTNIVLLTILPFDEEKNKIQGKPNKAVIWRIRTLRKKKCGLEDTLVWEMCGTLESTLLEPMLKVALDMPEMDGGAWQYKTLGDTVVRNP